MLSIWDGDILRLSEPTARTLGAAGALFAWAAMATSVDAKSTSCWIDHGAVVAPAAFADIAGDFIIDLSRPASALHDTRARADGITAATAFGPLTLAGEHVARFELAVVDLDAETRPFDTVINGVIGWDVLGRYVVELDLRRGRCRLTLVPPHRRRPSVAKGLQMDEVGGAPALPAAISDGLETRAGLFRIDTGQDAVEVADARLSRPKVGKDAAAPIRLRAVSVDGALIEQAPAAVMESPIPGVLGGLGLSVWRGGILRLDPVEGRVIFRSPRQDPPGPRR